MSIHYIKILHYYIITNTRGNQLVFRPYYNISISISKKNLSGIYVLLCFIEIEFSLVCLLLQKLERLEHK